MVRRRHPLVPGEPANQDRVELEFLLRTWASTRSCTEFEVEEAV